MDIRSVGHTVDVDVDIDLCVDGVHDIFMNKIFTFLKIDFTGIV